MRTGTSQGTAYPDKAERLIIQQNDSAVTTSPPRITSHTSHLVCDQAAENQTRWGDRGHPHTAEHDRYWAVGLCTSRPDLRPRIRPRDARTVRSRVERRADELGLRCASQRALQAVLTLLLDYNVIRDTRARLHQVALRFPAGTRLVTTTTLGRLLSKLDRAGLIVYRPAQGRSRYAGLAIHPDFLDGICELQRDKKGRVIANLSAEIVNFYDPRFLIGDLSPTTPKSPPADRPADSPLTTRPTEVNVDPRSVHEVLAAIPACYRQVPGRVLGALAKEITGLLSRGWLPAQIAEILGATMPKAAVSRPLQLARWRLRQNMIGSGPRLAPLQRRWEAEQAALERTRHTNQLDASYQRIVGQIGSTLAERVVAIDPLVAPGLTSIEHRRRHVVSAARIARRQYPRWPLDAAINAWCAEQELTAKPPRPGGRCGEQWTTAALLEMTPAGRCVQCGSIDAEVREELPLPTPVCDTCWEELAEGLRHEVTCAPADQQVTVDQRGEAS